MFTPDRFFVTGGTLRPDAPCYIERRADRELLEALSLGEFCYVLTSRQMGKSSLMVRTAGRLRAAGRPVVVLDLTAAGQNLSPEQWYRSLLDLASDQLGCDLEDYWLAHQHRGPLGRFIGALESLQEPLVVFIDEIDAVQSLPFPTDELFAAIRECYNRRARNPSAPALTFCLLGVATPADLIRNPRATPFNIGRRIELTDFTPNEAAPLARGLAAARECGGVGVGACGSSEPQCRPTPLLPYAHTPTRLLRRVLHWTGGHPYLTQRLCDAVASRAVEGGKPAGWGWRGPETLVDQVAHELFFATGARKRDPNLHLVHERLLRGSTDVAATLDLYRRVLLGHRVKDEGTNLTVAHLQLSGTVRSDRGHLQPRNRIYARAFDARWIAEHMPDAEERRQRAAFRRGLARAGAIAMVVLSLVGSLAGVAANEAHEATQLTKRLGESIAQKDAALAKLGKAYEEIARERNRARWQAARATASEARERRQRQTAEALRVQAQAATLQAEEGRRRATELGAIAEERRKENHERLVRVSVANGMHLADEGRPFEGLHWLINALQLDSREPARAQAHRTRIDSLLRQAPSVSQAWNAGQQPYELAISPDGSRAVVASLSGDVHLWNTRTGEPTGETLHLQARQRALRFSRDGKLLLAATGAGFQVVRADTGGPLSPRKVFELDLGVADLSPDGRYVVTSDSGSFVCVWEAATGRRVAGPVRHDDGLESVTFSADSRRFFTSAPRGKIQAWRVPDGARLPLTLRAPGRPLKVSSDGRWLAALGGVGAMLFHADTGRLQMSIPGEKVQVLEFSADGRRLITASGGEVRLWDVERARQVGKTMRHAHYVQAAAFQPTGAGILTLTADGAVRTWDGSGTDTAVGLTHLAGAASLGLFDPGGRQVLLARTEGLIQLWNLHERGPLLRSHRPVTQAPIALSADTRRFLTEDAASRLVVRDTDTGAAVGPTVPSPARALALALNASGTRFAVACADRSVQCYETATGKPVGEPWRHTERVHSLEFTAGERSLIAVDAAWAAHLRDSATGREATLPLPGQGAAPRVAVSADGEHLAIVRHRDNVVLRTLGPNPIDREIPHREVDFITFSPDSRWLLTASRDRSVQLWNTHTLAPQGRPVYHDSWVTFAAFSGDGRSFVLCGDNQSARVWRWDGTPRTPLLRLSGAASAAAFSPDGERLVTLAADGRARLWDIRRAEALTVSTPVGHGGGSCRFSPDGRRVLFALDDGELHTWTPSRELRPTTTLTQLVTAVTGQRLETTTGNDVIPAADAASLWEKCRPRLTEIPRSDPEAEAERSRHEAARLEPRRAWPAVAAHLDRVVAVAPGEVGLRLRRARARAEVGRYGDAADDLTTAMELGRDDHLIHYERALLRLGAADSESYEAACKQMLDRFSSGGAREMDLAAWTCALGSNSPENLTRAIELVRRLLPREPQNPDYRHTLGVLLYRSGQYEEATAYLREAVRLRGEGESSLLYYHHLALVLRRLGEDHEARHLLETARLRREQSFQSSADFVRPWADRVESQLLEAELLSTRGADVSSTPVDLARGRTAGRASK